MFRAAFPRGDRHHDDQETNRVHCENQSRAETTQYKGTDNGPYDSANIELQTAQRYCGSQFLFANNLWNN